MKDMKCTCNNNQCKKELVLVKQFDGDIKLGICNNGSPMTSKEGPKSIVIVDKNLLIEHIANL